MAEGGPWTAPCEEVDLLKLYGSSEHAPRLRSGLRPSQQR